MAETFSAEERAAMKEAAAERRAQAKRAKTEDAEAADLADVLAKIESFDEPDRALAEHVHRIVLAAHPALKPKTWYGMPAYTIDGNIVCFFQSGLKFKTRYCTLGFQQAANLDEGNMWPTSFALTAITPTTEKQITELVKRAVA